MTLFTKIMSIFRSLKLERMFIYQNKTGLTPQPDNLKLKGQHLVLHLYASSFSILFLC
jgi:hypothetical protein